jgi:transposase
MKILALDLGKFKTVFCDYDTHTTDPRFGTLATTPQAMHDLLVEQQPDRLVMEVSHVAGWIHDLARTLNLDVQVANPNSDGWRWQHVKRKTDRDDALKLAKLSAMDQLPTVHMPGPRVRQWRALIAYRHKLVGRRTAVRNAIRALLDAQGIAWPRGASGWTQQAMEQMRDLSQPLIECSEEQLWRGQLHLELKMYEQLQPLIDQVEAKLDALAKQDARVEQLRTIEGVGPRLAEMVVAWIDDPHRFRTGREVGAYAGLTPKQHQSGQHDRLGRITRQGPGLLRKLLVEIAWGMRRRNPRAAAFYERMCHGQKTRRKQAAVALARKVLVWCWAMLRDGTTWQPQPPPARG